MQHVCRSGVTLATMQARLVFSSGCLQGAPAAGAHNPARWHPQLTGCQQRHLHQARPSGGSAFSQQGSASVAACCSSAPSTSCASSVAVHSTSSRSAGALATHARLVASRQVPYCRMVHGHPARCMASTQRELSSSSAADEEKPPPHLVRMKVNFCRQCGSSMHLINQGKSDWRHVCSNEACGYIDYFNPKMVVGCIVEHEGQVLMCRRAIEPCKGKWTIPAGFMELNESTAEGAARETWEEAHARVHIVAPYFHWDLPAIGQAYILFRAKLAAPFTFQPGPESLETRLFAPTDIPFDDLAFSSVATSLNYYLQDMRSGSFPMHHGVIDKVPGSSFNDPTTFCVRNHVTLPLSSMDYGSGTY